MLTRLHRQVWDRGLPEVTLCFLGWGRGDAATPYIAFCGETPVVEHEPDCRPALRTLSPTRLLALWCSHGEAIVRRRDPRRVRLGDCANRCRGSGGSSHSGPKHDRHLTA